MGYRIHRDGSITVDTLEEAIKVQQAIEALRPKNSLESFLSGFTSVPARAEQPVTTLEAAKREQPAKPTEPQDPLLRFLVALQKYHGTEIGAATLQPLLGVSHMGVGPRLGKVRRSLEEKGIALDRYLLKKSKDGRTVWLVNAPPTAVAQK